MYDGVEYELTELMNIGFCYSAKIEVSMCRRPLENIVYKFVIASPAVHSMPCSF